MKLTFLGTGTSFGIPQLGCSCAVCRSPDPRDKRTRVGAVVESDGGTRVLIDTPPELRLQLDRRRDRSRRRRAVHARSRRSHARHRRPSRDHDAPRRRRCRSTARGDARRARRTVSTTSSTTTFARCRERRSPRARRTRSSRGSRSPSATSTSCRSRFRTGTVDSIRISDRAARLRHRREVDPAGGACELLRGARVLVINALFRTEHPTHLSIPEAHRCRRARSARSARI